MGKDVLLIDYFRLVRMLLIAIASMSLDTNIVVRFVFNDMSVYDSVLIKHLGAFV